MNPQAKHQNDELILTHYQDSDEKQHSLGFSLLHEPLVRLLLVCCNILELKQTVILWVPILSRAI